MVGLVGGRVATGAGAVAVVRAAESEAVAKPAAAVAAARWVAPAVARKATTHYRRIWPEAPPLAPPPIH